MSYEKVSIRKIIDDIDHNKAFLPAIQRKFIWGKHQIELFFDSLMRNYPFGTFLFWRLRKEKAESYVFYEFLKEYDERSPYNRRKTGSFTHQEIIGILDGQQRLSSLYLGMMGTHTEKAPYKRASNPNAYKPMSLYLNLLSLPYQIGPDDEIVTLEDQNFEFRFLTDQAAQASVSRQAKGGNGLAFDKEPMFWMKVGQVYSWNEEPEFDRLAEKFLDQCSTDDQRKVFSQKKRLVRRGLELLHKRIHKDELINYFEVNKDDLEDILKIFVRVNSGGTVLSKTDLLFSTIVATWDDGRDQIEGLLKKINDMGDKFSFGNEFLMRCCLVLIDGPVLFKVNSFKSQNVQKIKEEWEEISKSIFKMVELLVEFGFNGSLLTSQNATIIIAYYIHKGGSLNKESKDDIKKYLIHALLKGIYGSGQERVLSALRNAFRTEEMGKDGKTHYRLFDTNFSFDEILKVKLPSLKSLAITEEELEEILESKKGSSAFLVLSLLYPQLKFNEVVFHQDHIHPAAEFTEKRFQEIGLDSSQRKEWLECRDRVPNLQLLEGRKNSSKNATPIKEWIGRMDESEQTSFKRDNFFPDNVDLKFGEFRKFYEERKKILGSELKKVLAVKGDSSLEPEIEWEASNEEIENQRIPDSGEF